MGYVCEEVDLIIRRFNNCYFKGYVKKKTVKIHVDIAGEAIRKNRKLSPYNFSRKRART